MIKNHCENPNRENHGVLEAYLFMLHLAFPKSKAKQSPIARTHMHMHMHLLGGRCITSGLSSQIRSDAGRYHGAEYHHPGHG